MTFALVPGAEGSFPVKRLVQCFKCAEMGDEYFFTLKQCIDQSYKNDSIWCPSHKNEVDLKGLAPDVLFADIDDKFLIKEGDIDAEQTKENAIGGGSFGNVYQTKLKQRKNVAVKVISLLPLIQIKIECKQ